jgi:hypothetical protein
MWLPDCQVQPRSSMGREVGRVGSGGSGTQLSSREIRGCNFQQGRVTILSTGVTCELAEVAMSQLHQVYMVTLIAQCIRQGIKPENRLIEILRKTSNIAYCHTTVAKGTWDPRVPGTPQGLLHSSSTIYHYLPWVRTHDTTISRTQRVCC